MGRRSCAHLALCYQLITLSSQVHGFVGPPARLSASAGRRTHISSRRCWTPHLSSFKCGRSAGSALSAAAEGEENGTGLEAENKRRRMTRAPLRITPNFQPRDKRKPKADAESEVPYGLLLTEESLVIAAMAWAEFSYWLRRTVERNVNGPKFEFDVRQWSSSIRKWCSRAVEMDAQAKAELLRLYDRGMLDRDWWGPQAVKVDARVEDEWDSIYVDCQDACETSSNAETRVVMAGGDTTGSSSGSSPRAASFPAATYSDVRREGAGAGRDLRASDRSGFELYVGGVEKKGEGAREDEENDLLLGEGEGRVEEDVAEGEGFDDEIIDCAIRGRWTFDNNDDPPHFSPQ